MDIEVNILPIINKLRKRKDINVYVPFMIGQSFKPVPYRLPLKTKKFAIKEPNFSNKMVKIDMAIVPVVGIDKLDKRIGFGKGMYDRYFWSLNHKPYIVFTQRVLCKSKEVLSNRYDIQANCIISHHKRDS
jgi:5-formyltetrahydrofolate cyclo-ligase